MHADQPRRHPWLDRSRTHAATDPGRNHPSSCSAILRLQGTAYKRITPTAPGTFECDPTWLAPINPPTTAAVAAKIDANRISQQFTPG